MIPKNRVSTISLTTPLKRLRYLAQQSGRVGFYLGHGFAMRRQLQRLDRDAKQLSGSLPPSSPPLNLPSQRTLLFDILTLLRQDLRNSEAGYFPFPRDHDGSLASLLKTSKAFFKDVPEVSQRRKKQHSRDIPDLGDFISLPDYYKQNFHFQTGGWLTEDSAHLYDMQVEVLFSGAANAMRRRGLGPLLGAIKGQDQRQLQALDIATGTGTMMHQIGDALPKLPVIGLDLSATYLKKAALRIPSHRPHTLLLGNAEQIPLQSGSVDIVTMVFLFHELPPSIRRIVAREVSRVLKPGGCCIIVDSLQTGDIPRYDGLLAHFPHVFHEPYYTDYLSDDLETMFQDVSMALQQTDRAFLSKVITFQKI